MLFETGGIFSSAGVNESCCIIAGFWSFVCDCVTKHASGDWGDLCEDDKKLNDEAVQHGGRILSAYNHPLDPDLKIYIITEADRSATTVLFPSEY